MCTIYIYTHTLTNGHHCGLNRDGSGDVNYAEFSAWWHKERQKREKSPATIVGFALAAATKSLAPLATLRRDAQRALVSRARAEARDEVRTGRELRTAGEGRGGEGMGGEGRGKGRRGGAI